MARSDDEFEGALGDSVMKAMSRYYVARQGAEFIGGSLIPRLFPSESDKQARTIGKLDILERKRRLGLPDDSDEYEALLNEHSWLPSPGRGLTLGANIARNRALPLKVGASPFIRSFENGLAGRGLGVIGKLFGR